MPWLRTTFCSSGAAGAEIEHLWFGLLTLAFATNAFGSSYWIYQITSRYDLAVRISDAFGQFAAMLAIQFIWTFFSRSIPRWLRAYQLSQGALALFVLFSPDIRIVVTSQTLRALWLLPLLVVTAALIFRETRRGDVEARTLAVAGLVMIAFQVLELAAKPLLQRLIADVPLPGAVPGASLKGGLKESLRTPS